MHEKQCDFLLKTIAHLFSNISLQHIYKKIGKDKIKATHIPRDSTFRYVVQQ